MKLPARLAPEAHEKIWGSPNTAPWFDNPAGRKIGELWFRASAGFPILAKILFTSESLSVQVHPDDDYAAQFASRGKTEMWHVLRAEPGARVALGLKEPVSPERFRKACGTAAVVDLLNWFPARAGDTFLTPAGTVHAIGGGLTICEVQQNSDITYRLYDYDRPDRDLHLDHGIRVSRLKSHPGTTAPASIGASRHLLAESDYFRTERLKIEGSCACESPRKNTLYIALEGSGTMAGIPFTQGQAFEVPAGMEAFEIASPAAEFLTTSEPS